MKRKIHYNVAILSTAITVSLAIFMIITFYRFNINNQMKALKSTGNLVSNIVVSPEIDQLDQLENYRDSDIRITLLDLEGEVLFDNIADADKIENHRDRPEFQDALKTGQGESVRYSSTLKQDNYYYAIKLQNDIILRVSHQADNLFRMFSSITPIILLIVIAISVFSYYTSSLLANHILRPINILTRNLKENSDQDTFKELRIYDELTPFIRTFESQNKVIKDRNRELEEKAYLLDTISSSMGEGIILLNIDKEIMSINQSGIGLFNGNFHMSYHGKDFIHLSRDVDLYRSLEASIANKSNNEIVINHNNKYLDIYINTVFSGDKLTGLLLLVVDTTEKHKLDLMRREFSANVSHELKTPLTSIIGYAEMINSGMVKDDDISKFASIIRKEGGRLLSLIDDIIKLSKIEDESTEREFEPINIYSLGKETIASLQILAQEKDIGLDLEGDTSFMMGNKGMLQDLIYNLLENSIKYTNPGGSIKLIIKDNKPNTIIQVIDTGIGIALEHQERIFERFYTADKSRSKKTESTGLGLSIVKHIVEYHKGKIDFKSQVGKGTEISIRFKSI